MPTPALESSQLAAPLAHRLTQGADAIEAAEALAAVWREVDLALQPIVGRRGVVALFNRSVHLTAAVHPWLAAARQDPAAELDVDALKSLFGRQGAAQAVLCGNSLLQSFRQVLATLIGASLSERLLRPAWGPPLTDVPLKDTPS
jgi:hypothetical protein